MKEYPQLFDTPYKCCGCTACYTACPVSAIQMKADKEGFLYPIIDKTVCVQCGKCEQVCQMKESSVYDEPIAIYASKNQDLNCRMESSSGGVFSLLAEYTENKNGSIYGAAFDHDFNVLHKRAMKYQEWKQFCQSKYVQSNLMDSFSKVKEDLENGLYVLFTGTPCQVEGLNRFLNKTDTTRLYTCDFVCHGVPSPLIWKEWLELTEKKLHKEFNKVNFRDKSTTGWHQFLLTFTDNNQKVVYTSAYDGNAFTKMFLWNLILRPSCHQCQWANYCRPADLTLGDYWGIEKFHKEFDDNKGVSLVMCNSQKGYEIWEEISQKTVNIQIAKDQCEQPNLLTPSKEHKNRKLFWRVHSHFGLTISTKLFRLESLNLVEKVVVRITRILLRILGVLK